MAKNAHVFIFCMVILLQGVMRVNAVKNELFNYGIYQSPNGKSVFKIPKFDDDKWNVFVFAKGDWRNIHITIGEKNQMWARIIIAVPPGYVFKNKVTSELVTGSILQEIQKANPILNKVMKAQKAEIGGGQATFQAIMGVNKNNIDVITAVVGMVDKKSTYAMWMIIESPSSIFEEIGKVVEEILPTVYIGQHIPILPDRKPSRRLEGIYHASDTDYKGEYTDYYLIFDKRGYFHTGGPNPLRLDFDVMSMYKQKELRWYDLQGDRLVQVKEFGKGIKKVEKIRIYDDKIALFGSEYKRIDKAGPKDGKVMDASYKNFYFSSSDGYYSNYSYSESNCLTFSKEGTISLQSSISSNFTSYKDPFQMSNDQMQYGDFTTIQGGNSLYDRDKDEGYYRIKDNILTVIYLNCEVDIRTIYYRHGDDGSLYVNGSIYRKQ